MNPNLCRVALRPRDPFEVFDLTFRFVRERLRPLLRLTAVVLLPPALLLTLLAWWFDGAWWLLFPTLAMGPILQAPFTLAGGRLLFGDDVAVGQVLVETLKRSVGLLGLWSAQGLGWAAVMAIGLASEPIAAISIAVAAMATAPVAGLLTTFVGEAVLLERVGLARAFRRSGRLMAGTGGSAIAATSSRWFLLVWLALASESSGQAILDFVLQLGVPFGSLMNGDVTPFLLAGMLLAQPAAALYRLLLYVDARTRGEGWDLQVSLRALGLQ
ncbi:MAG: hypothetical protein KC912_26010 [Proteobacteria bacterium]|nr:hypothetical protein [Pseudomonadota bacterium]